MNANETLEARITRLSPAIEAVRTDASTKISDVRRETLTLAMDCNDALFVQIAGALRVARAATIVLPCHRYENLSRGKGWARKGKGSSAEWGERVSGGYEVGSGRWTVGGNDGFTRKGETSWDVKHVTVNGATWTLAN